MNSRFLSLERFARGVLLLWGVAISSAQTLPAPTRVWSVGPLTKSEEVRGLTLGNTGATFTGPHVDSQTGSIFAATRSVVFAGDRIVVATRVGTRRDEGTRIPGEVYQLLSLDIQTGQLKDSREMTGLGPIHVFATNDGHLIVTGSIVLRLTPELKDAGHFDYHAQGHKFGKIENISPNGSTLGNQTSPGYELVDSQTLKATELTASPAVATSVSSKGFVTDNVYWVRGYPKDLGFVTYTDRAGEHLLYHGKCGVRPQFLSDDLILESGCKNPLIINTHGDVVRTLTVHGAFSFAGVSQNGKRFALQLASFSSTHSVQRERFVVYSVDTGEAVAELTPDQVAEEQSWTAFPPDGSMIVVGSPLKLTLYRLP